MIFEFLFTVINLRGIYCWGTVADALNGYRNISLCTLSWAQKFDCYWMASFTFTFGLPSESEHINLWDYSHLKGLAVLAFIYGQKSNLASGNFAFAQAPPPPHHTIQSMFFSGGPQESMSKREWDLLRTFDFDECSQFSSLLCFPFSFLLGFTFITSNCECVLLYYSLLFINWKDEHLMSCGKWMPPEGSV